jgi:hypothetical protein
VRTREGGMNVINKGVLAAQAANKHILVRQVLLGSDLHTIR